MSGYISGRNKIAIFRRYLCSHLHHSSLYNSDVMEKTYVSPDKQWKKEMCLCLYYSALDYRKYCYLQQTIWLDLEDIMLSEIS